MFLKLNIEQRQVLTAVWMEVFMSQLSEEDRKKSAEEIMKMCAKAFTDDVVAAAKMFLK